MTSWYEEFNSVFFTGIATMAFGGLALLVRYAFASKCDNVKICFGLIQIHRVVELENNVEQKDDEDATVNEDVETKQPA